MIKNITNMTLSTKLLASFLLVGILPACIIGLLSLKQAGDALTLESENKLIAMRDVKKGQIEDFFNGCNVDIDILSKSTSSLINESMTKISVVQELKKKQLETLFERMLREVTTETNSKETIAHCNAFKQYHDDMNTPADGNYDISTERYKTLWNQSNDYFSRYVKELQYEDIYLVCAKHGHVMFTHSKRSDLGKNVKHGLNKTEGLAQIWQKVIDTKTASIVDFQAYTPKDGKQTAFLGSPVKNEQGDIVSVFALQLPIKAINQIVQQRAGLGQTGESYLTGQFNSNTSYRSNRVVKESNIGQAKSGSGITKALSGETVKRIKAGSTGNLEVEFCDKLKIKDLHWVLSTTMAMQEIVTVKMKGQSNDFFTHFCKTNDFYDLFLITPKGHVFYTVSKEADLGTNMLTGPYKDSGLGQLFQEVINNKTFGFSDFSPYEPSNNEPAAFIANPIMDGDDLQFIVALQLSDKAINNVMQTRAGMGQTGETILVGPDYLMRSDSFRDPEHHSITASFANPSTGKVDTPATRAVQEQNETGVIKGMTDYIGNKVLLAYTPVDIFGTTWCLNAKIDESEAFAARKTITQSIVFVIVIAIGVILGAAWLLIRSVTGPIKQVNTMLEDIAQGDGDLTQRLNVTTKDEIGYLAKWFNLFMDKLQNMIKDISGQAQIVGSSSTELATVSDQMQQGSKHTSDQSNTVSAAAEEMSSNMNSVAAAMEQATTNVNTVASAAEQMSSSIGQIAQNTERASTVTQQAVQETQSASTKVSELGTAAEEIGKVTQTITEISEQTNLLALNATIEAARAGDAGKGFAVVANEIKELANQTAGATEEIRTKINDIQNSTGETVHEIEKITKVINDVNEIVSTIARSVEEQSSAVQEIASNVAQASSGLGDVNENVAQTSTVAGEVASNIADLNNTSTEMAQNSNQINDSVSELSQLSETLNGLVGQFKV